MVGRARKGQVWCALLSLSLGLSVATATQIDLGSRGVGDGHLEDRALDSSLAEGFLGVPESSTQWPFYLTLVGSFLVYFLATSLLNGWIGSRLESEAVDRERSGILLLSQISLILYVLHLYLGDVVPESLRTGLHLLCGLLILVMVVKLLVHDRLRARRDWAVFWSLLNDDQLVLAALFFPVSLVSLIGLTRGVAIPWTSGSSLSIFAIYFLVLIILAIAYTWLAQRVAAGRRGGVALALYELNTAVMVAGAPLALIPLATVVANEVQFAVPSLSPRAVALSAAVGLVVISAILFVLQQRGRLRVTGASLLSGFYFPTAVATLATVKTHRHTLDLGVLDYFRSGELTLPAQQWTELGSVPMLDLLPGRGLADFGFQTLFTGLNGVHGLDMLVWLPWVPVVVGYLLIYGFLSVVISPVVALLVTVLLPIRAVVVGHYAVVLLPALVLVWVIRRPGFSRYLVLWMTTAALLLWRPHVGLPAAIAIVATVAIMVLFEHRQTLASALGSLGLAIGMLPAGLLIAEVLWGGDTYAALSSFLAQLGAPGSGELGASFLVVGPGDVANFLEGVLPVLAVVIVLYYFLGKLVMGRIFHAPSHAILYLTIFSLVLPARAVVGAGRNLFDPSLLLLTLAVMPFFVLRGPFRTRMLGRSSWLFLTIAFGAFLGQTDLYNLVSGGEAFRLRTWQKDEQRVRFETRPHRDLVEFLQAEVGDGESFVDFTDSPVLYALSGMRFPFREISQLGVTSESRQRSQIAVLEEVRGKGGLPFVVFRAPSSPSRSEAGLPREVTSYRIAEFIYRNYVPYAHLSGWGVWRERGVQRDRPRAPAKVLNPGQISQDFWLGSLPYRWAREDPWQSVDQTDVLLSLLDAPVAVRPQVPATLSWMTPIDPTGGNYLHIRARSLAGAVSGATGGEVPSLTVGYGSGPESSFRFTLAPWEYTQTDGEDRLVLDLRTDPKSNQLESLSLSQEGLVFRSAGKDPWVRRFVDLKGIPTPAPGEELWVSLQYRSNRSGVGQIYFAAGRKEFSESRSVKVPIRAGKGEGPPLQVTMPVVVGDSNQPLTDLRFDPPIGSEFEIAGVELVRRPRDFDDYLIRLSSQWRWVSDDIQQLILRSNSSVLVDSVYIRSGD